MGQGTLRRLRPLPWLPLLWLLLVGPAVADGEHRVALVIGVGAYAHAPALENPGRDAKAMAETLGALGFRVDLVLDPDYRRLSTALREFGYKAQDADLTLVYFAGHGVQVEGQNFLIPADAQLERERDLVYEALPLNLFLGELGQAKKLGIMLLDACRDNPFVDRLARSAGTGPATVRAGMGRIDDTPSDTLVAMATRANAVAEDGGGEHSPYAQALIDELKTPGTELGLFFRRVRDRVRTATNGRQEPYVFGSYGAEPVYLNPKPANRPPVVLPAPPVTVADNAGPTVLGIPGPSDPDDDQLVVQVSALPQGGTVLVGDRALLIGDYLTVEQLRAASFRPDGSRLGDAGSFDYTVSDGRGGSTKGSVAITVQSSNHPPVAAAETVVRAVVNRFPMPAASDPDGDPLTVRVRAVPERGRVRNGRVPLEVGDRLDLKDVASLTFDPEDAAPGPAGKLELTVEDGKGGEANATVSVEIVAPDQAAATSLDEALWRRLGPGAKEDDLRAFVQLFPQSPFAAEARQRLAPVVAAAPPVPPAAAATAKAAQAEPQRPEKVAVPPAAELKAPDTKVAEAAPPVASKPTTPRTNGDGTSFQDCADCPILVHIPAGSFTMGRDDGDRSERPAHKVAVAKPFALGRYEVTVGQWKACVAGGGCPELPPMKGFTDGTPVYNVTYGDAAAYAAWLARKTGQKYRLPSEAEWEYAAHAGTTTAYWWGDKADAKHVLCRKCGAAIEPETPPAVDSQPASPWGLVGMSGGVREWLADCWLRNYDKAPADARPRVVKGCQQHVTRGGSWLDEPADLTVTSRGFYDADAPYLANGFRVARDLE
jgi:formylglycine-generating enzyme required for sulfatase activity